MANRYIALETIDYSSLQLSRSKQKETAPSAGAPHNPTSLLQFCCRCVCKLSSDAVAEVVNSIPVHLAPILLKQAVLASQASSVASIIANWPLQVLRFKEILDSSQQHVFEEEMALDLVVFKGITGRTPRCRLRLMDLRGYQLSGCGNLAVMLVNSSLWLDWNFAKLVVQMWPLLSLKKSQRNAKYLSGMVLKEAGLKKDTKLANEIIPKIIDELLSNDMAKHPSFSISIPKGEKVCIRIERLEFSTQNTFFMDYLITNCLRSITPINVTVSNIIIRSDLNIGDGILDSLAPFIVFRGHDPECLEGIWLENLEDNVFFITSQDLQVFSQLKGFAVPNCNVMLQAGRTRRRTSVRRLFTQTLSSFSHLVRLDLSQNCFAGCLPEILDALFLPLEYLCLRECDLLDSDMQYLSTSRHASSIKQLNVSKICGLFPEDSFAVETGILVRCLQKFTAIQVLHMQQNQITDPKIIQVCSAIRSHWPELKALNISDNIFSSESALHIVEASVERPTMQNLKIPYSHNLFEAINLMENGRQQFSRRVAAILDRNRRSDINVEVFSVAYAVLANI
ncbi:hypothetical protein CAPTEDRAFT_228081 [Capitella teleta]|uniref:Leucine-rich repeat-containing protein 14 n=1 Tax=Capitella teleta TaxID=283909 RepID=R7UR29_CAPTE|nr:hypothetical protein CAPTEDRAFT_228081 [Capitella teleta]|eukprot:ELU08994.1 hypothetical protein CAPTEDRAFT_228081 [Capitella teleta]